LLIKITEARSEFEFHLERHVDGWLWVVVKRFYRPDEPARFFTKCRLTPDAANQWKEMLDAFFDEVNCSPELFEEETPSQDNLFPESEAA
jgi:hypothetical protein